MKIDESLEERSSGPLISKSISNILWTSVVLWPEPSWSPLFSRLSHISSGFGELQEDSNRVAFEGKGLVRIRMTYCTIMHCYTRKMKDEVSGTIVF